MLREVGPHVGVGVGAIEGVSVGDLRPIDMQQPTAQCTCTAE